MSGPAVRVVLCAHKGGGPDLELGSFPEGVLLEDCDILNAATREIIATDYRWEADHTPEWLPPGTPRQENETGASLNTYAKVIILACRTSDSPQRVLRLSEPSEPPEDAEAISEPTGRPLGALAPCSEGTA